MAKEKSKQEAKTKKPELREINFKCAHCHKSQPLEDMRIVTRFFPLVTVCRECEKDVR